MKVLIVMSSHKNSKKTGNKFSFPSFLPWPPSTARTLSYGVVRYIVLDGFCPWFVEAA